jgi:hypothetical protein
VASHVEEKNFMPFIHQRFGQLKYRPITGAPPVCQDKQRLFMPNFAIAQQPGM